MGDIQVQALSGVSTLIKRGEMVAIMGPSGSGKSTLMNILGCLDTPTSGSYLFEGKEIGKFNDDQLAEVRNRKIGFIFQSFNLLRRTTAAANVELPLVYGNGRGRRERALKALERVGLAHRANHKPSELSGGEQQRVAIARALVNNPSLILADEPTGNLDSRSSNEIMDIFCQLNKKDGITLVLVTHERDVALFTQRIIFVKDGKVVNEEILKTGSEIR
ncbi:MAG: ABC transporter ATP-binding protein [Dehalococcoidia bacterium]|nr:ABC transporter ATP-binding protein [Dehalococcoidia bacterium]